MLATTAAIDGFRLSATRISFLGENKDQLTASGGMGDVGTDEDDRLGEDLRAHGWHQNVVDAAQFDVDLQAQIRQCLR